MRCSNEDWAVFWCSLLSPVLLGEIPERRRERYFQQLSQEERLLPNGQRRRVSVCLLYTSPASTCHRFAGAVAPQKFRSPQREQLLRCARQLLHLIAEWEGVFREKFFPRFATRSGFL